MTTRPLISTAQETARVDSRPSTCSGSCTATARRYASAGAPRWWILALDTAWLKTYSRERREPMVDVSTGP
jgi:hypothetical protein